MKYRIAVFRNEGISVSLDDEDPPPYSVGSEDELLKEIRGLLIGVRMGELVGFYVGREP